MGILKNMSLTPTSFLLFYLACNFQLIFPFFLRTFSLNSGSGRINQSVRERCGEGNGNPVQYSCLENPMHKGASWATVHGVAKSWTQLSYWHTHIGRKNKQIKWLRKKGRKKMEGAGGSKQKRKEGREGRKKGKSGYNKSDIIEVD